MESGVLLEDGLTKLSHALKGRSVENSTLSESCTLEVRLALKDRLIEPHGPFKDWCLSLILRTCAEEAFQ